jgi:hypothetical protein
MSFSQGSGYLSIELGLPRHSANDMDVLFWNQVFSLSTILDRYGSTPDVIHLPPSHYSLAHHVDRGPAGRLYCEALSIEVGILERDGERGRGQQGRVRADAQRPHRGLDVLCGGHAS